MRDGSGRSIRSRSPGACSVSLDTRRGLLAAAQSSGGGTSSSPSDGGGARRGSTRCERLPSRGGGDARAPPRSPLVVVPNTSPRRARWIHHARARRTCRARRPPCRARRGDRYAPQAPAPTAPFPSATLPTTTESYDIELRGRLETHGADTGPRADRNARSADARRADRQGRSEDPRPNRCAASTTATTEVAAGRPLRRTRRGRSRYRRLRTVAGGVVPEAAMAGNVEVRDFDAPRAFGVPVPGRPASSTGSRTLPTDP